MASIKTDKRFDNHKMSDKKVKKTGSKYYEVTIPFKVLPRSKSSTRPNVDLFNVEIH